jgi:hypothetical protein
MNQKDELMELVKSELDRKFPNQVLEHLGEKALM